MKKLPWLTPTLAAFSLLICLPSLAAATIIELSAEASLPAINDMARATVSAEAAGTTPGELSREVNGMIAEALKTAKSVPGVKVQNSGTSTYPVYPSKGGKIESWRMRSALALESTNIAALSELLGKLQSSLAVSSLVLQPSPETRKKIENDAMLEALNAFKARAKVIADAMGKPYRIKQIRVNTSGGYIQPMYRAAAKSMMTEAVPMPVEAGETQVSATVAGQIELE